MTNLQYATRLQGWTATQPSGFAGSKEWGVLATDLRRLASAYNTAMPNPGQQGLGSIAQARRINDDELVKAAANVEEKIDGFRTAYDSALAANTNITPETRQAAIQQVDAMKKNAQALNAALASDKEGVAEADALLKGTRGIIDTASKLPPSSPATVSWTPLRDDLATIALAYEITPASQ
jgi:hypothetical protein